MVGPDELGHRITKIIVMEFIHQRDHVSLVVADLQVPDHLFIPYTAIQYFRMDQSELTLEIALGVDEFKPFDELVEMDPDVSIIPDRESHEIALQISIFNGMTGKEILTADAPVFRDHRPVHGPMVFDPIAGGMMDSIHRPGMDVITITGGVLSIHLDHGHDLFPIEMGSAPENLIILGPSGTPRKVFGPRVFFGDRHDSLNVGANIPLRSHAVN